MPQNLNKDAIEQGTLVVTAAFTDEDGSSVVPNNITWTLTDVSGNVVNARSAVVIAVPAASNDIVLSGNDFITSNGINEDVFLTVVADYDSSNGSGLPVVDQVRITIEDLVLLVLSAQSSETVGATESVTASVV